MSLSETLDRDGVPQIGRRFGKIGQQILWSIVQANPEPFLHLISWAQFASCGIDSDGWLCHLDFVLGDVQWLRGQEEVGRGSKHVYIYPRPELQKST